MKGTRALTPLEIQAVCAAFDGKYELPLRPTPGVPTPGPSTHPSPSQEGKKARGELFAGLTASVRSLRPVFLP